MKIAITGSSGYIGSALVPFLTREGHNVVRLVRGEPRPGTSEVRWNPGAGTIDAGRLKGIDAAINLAGESLAAGRWTEKQKARIRDSRLQGTTLLSKILARLEPRPSVLVSASAVGYYGDRGDEVLTEESGPGSDFLADIVRRWEETTQPAAEAGIRVVNTRSGVVYSSDSIALTKMLLPFKLGLGGKLGTGRQWLSWVSLEDEVRAFHHALITDSLSGPVNVVAPGVVTNAELTKTLGRVLHRPVIFTVPAFALRVMFGEVADAMLLASQRVDSSKLIASGFVFNHPNLEPALESMLSSVP